MQVEMHGKKIESIDLDPRWTQSGNPERIQSGVNAGQLSLDASYHGDHDQFWIVDHVKGRELRRWHPRAVMHIVWSSESESEST